MPTINPRAIPIILTSSVETAERTWPRGMVEYYRSRVERGGEPELLDAVCCGAHTADSDRGIDPGSGRVV